MVHGHRIRQNICAEYDTDDKIRLRFAGNVSVAYKKKQLDYIIGENIYHLKAIVSGNNNSKHYLDCPTCHNNTQEKVASQQKEECNVKMKKVENSSPRKMLSNTCMKSIFAKQKNGGYDSSDSDSSEDESQNKGTNQVEQIHAIASAGIIPSDSNIESDKDDLKHCKK